MKKVVAALLLSLLLCCGLYAVFVALPSWPSSPLIAKAVADQQALEPARQAARNDPKQNGFLQAEVKALWDDAPQPNAVSTGCSDLANYGAISSNYKDLLQPAFQSKDAKFARACKSFEAYAAPLQTAARRPHFLVPGEGPSFGPSALMQSRGLSLGAEALLTWGQTQALGGQLDAALQANLSVLRWGHTLAADAVAPGRVRYGLRLRDLGREAVAALLYSSGSRLSVEQLRALQSELQAARIPRSTLETSLEGELAGWEEARRRNGGVQLVEQVAEEVDDATDQWLLTLPGMRQREARVAEGVMVRHLEEWQARADAAPAAEVVTHADWFSGRATLTPLVSRPDLLDSGWRRSERRLAFVRLAVAVWLHRAEHGNFPAKLADLGWEPEPLLPLDEVKYDGKTLSYATTADDTQRVVAPEGMEAWNTTSLATWTLPFTRAR